MELRQTAPIHFTRRQPRQPQSTLHSQWDLMYEMTTDDFKQAMETPAGMVNDVAKDKCIYGI